MSFETPNLAADFFKKKEILKNTTHLFISSHTKQKQKQVLRIAKSEIYFPSVLSFKSIRQIDLRFGSHYFGIRFSEVVLWGRSKRWSKSFLSLCSWAVGLKVVVSSQARQAASAEDRTQCSGTRALLGSPKSERGLQLTRCGILQLSQFHKLWLINLEFHPQRNIFHLAPHPPLSLGEKIVSWRWANFRYLYQPFRTVAKSFRVQGQVTQMSRVVLSKSQS